MLSLNVSREKGAVFIAVGPCRGDEGPRATLELTARGASALAANLAAATAGDQDEFEAEFDVAGELTVKQEVRR